MPDLSKQDLGNGYTLVFQETPYRANVRAVVKDAAGAIIIRGPVVENNDGGITVTKRAALFEFATTVLQPPNFGVDAYAAWADDTGDPDSGDDVADDGEDY